MANANAPFGLWPERQTSGQYWTGAANTYFIPSSYGSNLFLGDPMVPTGTSDANGIPGVTLATAGSSNYTLGPIVGIVSGGEPIIPVTRDLPIYHPASTGQYVLIADDVDMMFKIQEDGNAGTNASFGNANLVAGSGSTVTGYSGWQLQSSSVATTNTLQLRILWPLRVSNNTPGTTNSVWLVTINLHSLSNTTGV